MYSCCCCYCSCFVSSPGSSPRPSPLPPSFSFVCSIVTALLVICVHELVFVLVVGRATSIPHGRTSFFASCVHDQVIPTSKSRQNRTTTSHQQPIRRRKQNFAKTGTNKGERKKNVLDDREPTIVFEIDKQHPCYLLVCLFVRFVLFDRGMDTFFFFLCCIFHSSSIKEKKKNKERHLICLNDKNDISWLGRLVF